jgi:hypothetical protein
MTAGHADGRAPRDRKQALDLDRSYASPARPGELGLDLLGGELLDLAVPLGDGEGGELVESGHEPEITAASGDRPRPSRQDPWPAITRGIARDAPPSGRTRSPARRTH